MKVIYLGGYAGSCCDEDDAKQIKKGQEQSRRVAAAFVHGVIRDSFLQLFTYGQSCFENMMHTRPKCEWNGQGQALEFMRVKVNSRKMKIVLYIPDHVLQEITKHTEGT